MKKNVLTLALLTAATIMLAQRPAIPRDAALEAKIEKQLARMTLDEKVGQMLELNLDIMGQRDANGQWQLNEQMLDTTIQKYKIGSILNAPATRAASVEQWQKWIRLIQQKSIQYTGIPDVYGLDHNHGVTYTQGGTLFPQPINLGASFNTELAREMAEVTAYESRAANCPWVYNPVVDLGRDPRWPRIWESFGEDAVVNSKMVVAEIKGYQGDDPNHLGRYHVGTSTKHYMAYGAPWTGKDRTPAYVSPQMLREKYFEPFRQAAMAGTLTMMVNSASINGVPVHASYELLTKWLKEDLQWDGMLVTDWADINNLFQREHVAKDKKDAIRLAINAGIDMSMDPYSVDFCILLKETRAAYSRSHQPHSRRRYYSPDPTPTRCAVCTEAGATHGRAQEQRTWQPSTTPSTRHYAINMVKETSSSNRASPTTSGDSTTKRTSRRLNAP